MTCLGLSISFCFERERMLVGLLSWKGKKFIVKVGKRKGKGEWAFQDNASFCSLRVNRELKKLRKKKKRSFGTAADLLDFYFIRFPNYVFVLIYRI